jgi:hypothetical protein
MSAPNVPPLTNFLTNVTNNATVPNINNMALIETACDSTCVIIWGVASAMISMLLVALCCWAGVLIFRIQRRRRNQQIIGTTVMYRLPDGRLVSPVEWRYYQQRTALSPQTEGLLSPKEAYATHGHTAGNYAQVPPYKEK